MRISGTEPSKHVFGISGVLFHGGGGNVPENHSACINQKGPFRADLGAYFLEMEIFRQMIDANRRWLLSPNIRYYFLRFVNSMFFKSSDWKFVYFFGCLFRIWHWENIGTL